MGKFLVLARLIITAALFLALYSMPLLTLPKTGSADSSSVDLEQFNPSFSTLDIYIEISDSLAKLQEGLLKFYKAFSKAQMIIKEKYNDPYYWGAFVMVGE